MRPYRVIGFIILCFALLVGVCLLFPTEGVRLGFTTLNMPTMAHLLGSESEPLDTLDISIPADTLAPESAVQDSALSPTPVVTTHKDNLTKNEPVITEDEPVITDSLLPDDYRYLTRFFLSLAATDSTSVRVVHFGDSQIEEDRMTRELRRGLQGKYGGGGVGIIPLHQTIPTQSVRQHLYLSGVKQNISGGPKRYLVYGPSSMHRAFDVYGVMGQVAQLDNDLVAGSEDVELQIEPGYRQGTESYFNRIRIFRNYEDSTILLPDSTTRYTLHLRGKWDIYGISLETHKGIIVDNIPMRGCSGYVFTQMNADELRHYFSTTNTRLIILQFGGNVMPYTTSRRQVELYRQSMTAQIAYLKRCAPQASFLFIGPGDMLTSINGELQTYPMLPLMDATLRAMCAEQHIAYWSLFQAMGGKGSMAQWQEKNFARSDGIHFSQKGAAHAGNLLAKWMLQGIQEFQNKVQQQFLIPSISNEEDNVVF